MGEKVLIFTAPLSIVSSFEDEHGDQKNTRMIGVPPRQTYLRNIGLSKGDPFIVPVGEQEVDFSQFLQSFQPYSETTPTRSSYYDLITMPPLGTQFQAASIDQCLQHLVGPYTYCLYGEPGSGKTTLRFALDAYLRQKPNHILSVSYQYFPTEPSLDNHWSALARELAVDLFIQIVEQFESDAAPTVEQIEALREQIHIGNLYRLIKRILDDRQQSSPWEIGSYWPAVYRPTVRRVADSASLRDFLKHVDSSRLNLASPIVGKAALTKGLEAARLWGFTNVIVLTDGVDTANRDQSAMLALLKPLLESLPDWEPHGVSYRFFLPPEVKEGVSEILQRTAPGLTFQPLELIMQKWDDESLHSLLRQRFRAAGARHPGFNGLAGEGLEGKLDQLLIRSADGLPRRLLQIISLLIDQHAARNPQDRLINLDDWQRMRRQWRYQPPVPLLPSDI